MPTERQLVEFLNAGKAAHPSWRDTITLESIERILEFSPLSMVHRITPRPYMIIAAGGHDIVHPAWAVSELFERAREPKRLVFLPYDQTALYFGQGLDESNDLAGRFFAEHLKLNATQGATERQPAFAK
jgi:fermentation-respiration switch protein FrsA (DUF1100 family)